MRTRNLLLIMLCSFLLGSCIFGRRASGGGGKSGCPSNGKNVGAEKILSGEKVPKAPKFKS